MCDVFNDVIIDRRKHGLKRDWSKAITLKDIVKQKIEVPCIIGDRGIILKSLENEPGKYQLPLIVIQLKDMRTDTVRMADLHADVFYQQDNLFAELTPDDPRYRPQELSKRRGQPINLSYDVTFITKYKEDLDQIISNFAVFFRPDIYLKWWHPRIKVKPLTSQLLWGHSVSFENNADFQPTNVFTYKATTSFTFKTWLFFGMDATDNTIDPNLEKLIKYVKIFPNRTGEDQDMNKADDYPESDAYIFGDAIDKTTESGLNFWSVDTGQEFVGTDVEKMKEGHYVVNNVFSDEYPPIADDPVISRVKTNPLVGDIMTNYDRWHVNDMDEYQRYMQWDSKAINTYENSFVKNIFFKGSYPQSAMYETPPSGDFLFNKYYKTYDVNEKIFKHEFGSEFLVRGKTKIDYDPVSKDLKLAFSYREDAFSASGMCIYNSDDLKENGYVQEFMLRSKDINGTDDHIGLDLHYEFNYDLEVIEDKTTKEYSYINPMNNIAKFFEATLYIQDYEVKSKLIKLRNILKSHWKAFNLVEKDEGIYWIEIEDTKLGEYLKSKNLYDEAKWRSLKIVKEEFHDNYFYHVLTNKYVYIVLKINAKKESDCDIYDWGVLFPMSYIQGKALLYEVTYPNSRELLGLNFYVGI